MKKKTRRTSSDRPYPGPAFPAVSNNILIEAETLVYGPRAKTYGHPRDNFKTIVDMWNAYLTRRGIVTDALIVERDVAMMFVLVKVAREGVAATRDNLVDIAGYAATAERLDE